MTQVTPTTIEALAGRGKILVVDEGEVYEMKNLKGKVYAGAALGPDRVFAFNPPLFVGRGSYRVVVRDGLVELDAVN